MLGPDPHGICRLSESRNRRHSPERSTEQPEQLAARTGLPPGPSRRTGTRLVVAGAGKPWAARECPRPAIRSRWPCLCNAGRAA